MKDDLEEMFADPNGPAYIRTETRTGVPLSYVAEKLRNTIETIHHIIQESPENSPNRSSARVAMSYAIRGYLALLNALGASNDTKLYERLEAMTAEQFSAWLDRVDREGSELGA